MVVLENLACTVQGLMPSSFSGESSEWRVVGQERDGGLLVTWVWTKPNDPSTARNCIGIYYRSNQKFEVVYEFDGLVNIVQASINSSKTALLYVTKSTIEDVNGSAKQCCSNEIKDKAEVYKIFFILLKEPANDDEIDTNHFTPTKPLDLGIERSLQLVGQFLYRTKDQPEDTDRFLILIHHESVSLYQIKAVFEETDDKALSLRSVASIECVVRSFTWAQWDPVHQCLFYIHFRKPVARLVEGDEEDNTFDCASTETARRQENELAPTLSGLQFHDNMPHETVLNIPLNLPLLPKAKGANCSVYEDDPIPLRVHDCSLDLTVLSDPRGIVCICHHYLYQPVKPSLQSPPDGPGKTVHFAYSVTLLHHGCVLHCVAPGIPWDLARKMRPSFALYGDQHMLVHAPGLFTHLLDIGLAHEPCCHILLDGDALTLPVSQDSACLAPLLSFTSTESISGSSRQPLMLDLSTLDLVPITIAPAHLLRAFRGGPLGSSKLGQKNRGSLLDNQLAVLHYVLVHLGNNELLLQLLNCIASQCMELQSHQLLQEILVGGAYGAAQKNLPSDAASLLPLLPLTVSTPVTQQNIKVSHSSLSLSQETLWNTAMMLLSPQQRLIPYRSDMWTRLYDCLAASQQRTANAVTCSLDSRAGARFRPCHVADKLMISLICYQPEALSRCSTPLSPGGNLVVSGATFSDVVAITGANRKSGGLDFLPFQEAESCTASKQEHVISVDEEAQIAGEDDLCSCPICEPDNTLISWEHCNDLPFIEMDSCAAGKQELIISVNLRELSMHLLKHALRGQSPLHVHAVATRYVAAQLDMSRSLCRLLCLAAKVDPRQERDRGFPLIDSLDDARKRLLFWLFERFLLAAESLAFPLPQGFTSFFTYLGYRTLSFSLFMQYAQRHAFELQVDVMKIIMSDLPDTPEGCCRKLRLLQLLPRSRAKRLLNSWPHPVSLMLRAREHSMHVLSGVESVRGARSARGPRGGRSRAGNSKQYQSFVNRGLAAFPSHDRLSPLDTFLDLLTAKASLAELDFGLLIEATIASTEDFSL